MSSESSRLKERGASQWAAAIAHPMVAEIGAGTLPHPTFRFYFEQNLLTCVNTRGPSRSRRPGPRTAVLCRC